MRGLRKGIIREKWKRMYSDFLGKQKEAEKQNNAQYYEMTPCASGGTVAHETVTHNNEAQKHSQ